jgi:hypothetical protein
LSLSSDDLESLVAYLVESTTSVAGEDEGAPEEATG